MGWCCFTLRTPSSDLLDTLVRRPLPHRSIICSPLPSMPADCIVLSDPRCRPGQQASASLPRTTLLCTVMPGPSFHPLPARTPSPLVPHCRAFIVPLCCTSSQAAKHPDWTTEHAIHPVLWVWPRAAPSTQLLKCKELRTLSSEPHQPARCPAATATEVITTPAPLLPLPPPLVPAHSGLLSGNRLDLPAHQPSLRPSTRRSSARLGHGCSTE